MDGEAQVWMVKRRYIGSFFARRASACLSLYVTRTRPLTVEASRLIRGGIAARRSCRRRRVALASPAGHTSLIEFAQSEGSVDFVPWKSGPVGLSVAPLESPHRPGQRSHV